MDITLDFNILMYNFNTSPCIGKGPTVPILFFKLKQF